MAYWDGIRWVPDAATPASSRPSRRRRLFGATAEASLIVTLVFGLIAGTTLAAPGNGKGGGKPGSYSVTIDQAGPYRFGDQVTVTTDAPIYPDNAGPWIGLDCYRDGVRIGSADHAGFEGGWYYGLAFALGPSQSWASGGADCVFTVYHVSNKRTVTDAVLSFTVES